MKFFGLLFGFTLLLLASAEPPTCSVLSSFDGDKNAILKDWISIKEDCVSEMKRQIQEEIGASLKYLSMAGHFSQDNVNRPGFAKVFFDAASEERQHAIKLIEYLSMRGENTQVPEFRKLPTKWEAPEVFSGESALLEALKMETAVTDSIVKVIKVCEDDTKCSDCSTKKKLKNDYHLVDYLTGEFLEEQYQGQKEIANRVVTLNKMRGVHKEMGEFLFDKKLLE